MVYIKEHMVGEWKYEHAVIIGIDQSLTNFAITFYQPKTEGSVSYLLRPIEFGVRRLAEIQKFLSGYITGWIKDFTVEIVMEGYAYGALTQREALGELGGAVKLVLHHIFEGTIEGYPTIVPPTVLKKYVSGRGNAKKNEMLLGAYKRWNFDCNSDDMVDSYCLARMGADLTLGKAANQTELAMLAKVKRNSEWEKLVTPRPLTRTTKPLSK